MPQYSRFLAAALTAFLLPTVGGAQNAAPQPQSAAKPAPAPVRDLSGIWAPIKPLDGIQPHGARDMSTDGKLELPYTPYGLEMAKRNKPSYGPTEMEVNDPEHKCEPPGFPRADLFELRATEILQTPLQTVVLYTRNRTYRIIWTDGRDLPTDSDPRWYGYSVGKWQDDYTFVVETNGTDDRTWLDNAGRPHSDELRVEEVFHRVDHDTLELSLTIHDPKVYKEPWVALNKLPLRLKPANFEMFEVMCSPGELDEYNRRYNSRRTDKQ